MRVLGTPVSPPALPENLQPLSILACDLRWTWRPSLRAVFAAIDPALWEQTRNPVALLHSVSPARLEELSRDPDFPARLSAAISELGLEDDAQPIHPAIRAMEDRGDRIAYFSAEFGISEALPIYAGGLGVLAGDHLKSSSDLKLPLIGVGLFYRSGYFRQLLEPGAGQREADPEIRPELLPLLEPVTPGGGTATLTLRVGERDVLVAIRLAVVGRVPLLLLDTAIPENHPDDQGITAHLYGGDQEMRIRQEIVLGIGGLRALERLKCRPTIRHLNEGHAAFVGLEKIRQLVAEESLPFAEARERAAAGNVFTTHTPVPAGIDRFTSDLTRKYLAPYVAGAGLELEEVLRLGQEDPTRDNEPFSMAVLALRLSGHANAVSKLHAKVSRRLWLGLLPELADEDVQIRAVTNGVHRPTWLDPRLASLPLVEAPDAVDRALFWRIHEQLRARLVDVCRGRVAAQKRRHGASPEEIEAVSGLLDPKALTIGFARRFATYKRATLLFQDRERLLRILRAGPVQVLFAGKAHPQDEPGKDLLRAIAQFAEQPEFAGRVVLLPDYDIALAQSLVSGCDVWLNNPIRPYEASGTSGMKAGMNGVLNVSVLDGWWDEAPTKETGFVIGTGSEDDSDAVVAGSLYDVLEQEVLPLFSDRSGEGVPLRWVEKMVQSASRIARLFSSDRMVSEYLDLCYLPAAERRIELLEQARPRAHASATPGGKVRG